MIFVSLNRACTKARSSQEDFPSLSLSVINVPDSSEELEQDCATQENDELYFQMGKQ